MESIVAWNFNEKGLFIVKSEYKVYTHDASTGRGTNNLGLLFFVRHMGLPLEEDLPPPKDILLKRWEELQVLITTTITTGTSA